MSQEPESARRVHSLGRFLLIDLLIEKRSRPVLIYVAITASIGAAIYHFVEGWRWLDSFYFVVITMTTIGYGDLSPATDLGRLFTIFFALNGVAILILLFDHIRRVRGPQQHGNEARTLENCPENSSSEV